MTDLLVLDRRRTQARGGGTPDGRTFVLGLRQVGPAMTRVGIHWSGEPDDALSRKILAGLARE